MRVLRAGSGVLRAAPVEGGPKAEVLAAGENLSMARVVLPPGGGMPEHDHGESEALVVVRSGRVVLRSGEREEELEAGAAALLGVGERVALTNPSSEEAHLLAVFSPPGFVRNLEGWPEAR
ncbi:MAG: cupin domain-containing protein [Rubrobacter sp.]|nr:cupin domain-containing protein [Rubrobacter sp.]